MRTLTDQLPGKVRPATLLVLLPPAKATIDDLVGQGFVADVRSRQLPVDVALAEVTYEQVMAKQVASTLREQVITPALAQGYSRIWLAGISLGAFNALHYAAAHGDHLAGLQLIAPYPGTGDILGEIAAAGGPAAWANAPDRANADERAWWLWLWQESARAGARKPVYVGLGSGDRFIEGQRMMAGLLPPANVDEVEGDHSWHVWRLLWQRWLDKGLLLDNGEAQE